MKRFLLLFSFIIGWYAASATHHRAGEITYRQVSALTYEFTIVTYTYSESDANKKDFLEVHWGDNTLDSVRRTNSTQLPNETQLNRYITRHTFPGPFNYKISFFDQNRKADIINITKSQDQAFYVETLLAINPFLGYNNSPVLLIPPIDEGCLGKRFVHNPGAVDPDGDSLSYEMTRCKGMNGKDLPGYFFPENNDGKPVTINPITGDLIWNAPDQKGEYNVAFIIKEWRNGENIGYVERDMQITIVNCINKPPKISPIPDFCVEAGKSIDFDVTVVDTIILKVNSKPEIIKDFLELKAYGTPLTLKDSPAIFQQPKTGESTLTNPFKWNTTCSHVRRQPYQVVFRVKDDGAKQPVSSPYEAVDLVDIKTVTIKVVGPPVKNFTVTPSGNSFNLKWDKNTCKEVVGYNIYKKIGIYNGIIECPCTTGVPSSTGFQLYKTIEDGNFTTFSDDDNGKGLLPGTNYCYYVTAVYKDGAESCASEQVCGKLKRDLPIITNVDIIKTSADSGTISIVWAKPTELDTVQWKGPFRYILYHSLSLNGQFSIVDSTNILQGLNATTLIHKNVNTLGGPHYYYIALYNYDNKKIFIGKSLTAGSVLIKISPTDNRLNISWQENTPWTNTEYTIYRLNQKSEFDSIGTTTTREFSDTGLTNGATYCYRVRSRGAYSLPELVNPIYNFSQELCAVPLDNVPPCPPTVSAFPECAEFKNLLIWNNPNRTCANDVSSYKIYYSQFIDSAFKLLTPVAFASDTFYLYINQESIAGCYQLTAIDTAGNESKPGNSVCVDNCPVYELPDIFTPNGDGVNDAFKPFPYKYVKDISLTVYDRWGLKIFETTDRDIKWDGKNESTKKDCSEGVYYYVCDVHEIRYNGIKTRTIKGIISLIRGEPTKSTE